MRLDIWIILLVRAVILAALNLEAPCLQAA
jgi:hypothetical protein